MLLLNSKKYRKFINLILQITILKSRNSSELSKRRPTKPNHKPETPHKTKGQSPLQEKPPQSLWANWSKTKRVMKNTSTPVHQLARLWGDLKTETLQGPRLSQLIHQP